MDVKTINFQTLRKNSPFWQNYVDHDFVKQLAAGTLPRECFLHYLKQDYLFLIQFVRAFSLAIYKSENFKQMRNAQAAINTMLDTEINLHIDCCKEWGISEDEILAEFESPATVAYTRYVLDSGMAGSLADLYAALAPCMLGYGEIGKILGAQEKVENNPYQAWIDTYSDQGFQEFCQETEVFIDELFANSTEQQAKKLQRVFDTATNMEVAFWQMGLDLS